MTTRRLFPVSLLGLAVALTAWGCKQEVVIPVYQAVPVSTRDIVVSASAAGAIEPIRTVDVKSKASGEITEVAVETGDAVRVGQRLVQVDPRVPKNGLMQAEADLEVAKAQLENAQSQLRRSDELYKTKSITEQEWETAKLQAANANAQLVRAQRSLEDARISYEDTDVRSPINGVVIQRNIEVGTVISSATNNVGGGTVLLQMANLDTVQVRAMVDETDIGKIQAGMAVTITVDAFPNRPFEGVVLKVEPQATTSQNVTMFPVLVRIPNPDGLLRPGMNAEVEMHVGRADGVLAVPNSALRTTRDVASAANVLGLSQETVDQQLAQAREASQNGGQASLGGTTAADSTPSNVYRTRDGREVTLPEGVTAQQVDGIFAKMRNGGPSALSESDRAVFQKIRSAMGGGFGARSGGGGGRPSGANAAFGGEYIVFVLRNGQPTAVQIRTGLTDLDYSEVRSGLTPQDTILVLPSASLVQSQEEFQNRVNRMGGGAVPGMQRTTTPTPPPGGRGR